jgi:hypothetical protein
METTDFRALRTSSDKDETELRGKLCARFRTCENLGCKLLLQPIRLYKQSLDIEYLRTVMCFLVLIILPAVEKQTAYRMLIPKATPQCCIVTVKKPFGLEVLYAS